MAHTGLFDHQRTDVTSWTAIADSTGGRGAPRTSAVAAVSYIGDRYPPIPVDIEHVEAVGFTAANGLFKIMKTPGYA